MATCGPRAACGLNAAVTRGFLWPVGITRSGRGAEEKDPRGSCSRISKERDMVKELEGVL